MVYWVGGGRGGNHLTIVGFKAKFFTHSFAGYLISKTPCASYRTYCTKCVKNSSIKILGGGGVCKNVSYMYYKIEESKLGVLCRETNGAGK